MKITNWIALGLLIASLICGMWIVASGAVNFFLASPAQLGGFNRVQLLIATGICFLAPATLALASGLVWWFGRRAESPSGALLRAEPTFTTSFDLYLNKMIELLFQQPWREGQLDGDIRAIIQAETRRVLTGMDAVQQGRVLLFLHSAGLLSGATPLSLCGIDLSGVDLRFAYLREVNLADANLRRAQLIGADLGECNMRGANLSEADLRLARFDGAILDECNLQQARLHCASLRSVSLQGTDLRDANLWGADLRDTQVT